MSAAGKVLVLGLGNRLLSDDGVGPHVVDALRARGLEANARVALQDGGTFGLALLPDIQDAAALIVVDAAMFGGAPGEMRVFEGEAMDAQLAGAKSTVHEVSLSDLIDAAKFSGTLPERRALVGIAPQMTEWGLAPTPEIAATMPAACAAVETLVARWAS